MKAFLFLLVFPGFFNASAQCDCDFTVPLHAEDFYADVVGVKPGDVICVEAGKRKKLHFHNIVGSEDAPVIIKNCGGQVHIEGKGKGNGNVPLSLNGNKYFRLTGTGDPSFRYGFKVGGEAHATVEGQGQATNFEMDHIEVFSSGFAGFMLKTDPDGSQRNVRSNDPDAVDGGFTMYDLSVHDCYIHDCLPDGEGIYMGNSFWSAGMTRYGDTTDRQYPHSIYGAKIYNNVIERTGREAIQAGAVVEGLEIYDNKIYDYGYKNPDDVQNNAIQIGDGGGRIYNNFIKNGPDGGSRGIFMLGMGDNYVYNNVIIGARIFAINANLRPSPLPGDPGEQGFLGGAYIFNNTIIDTNGGQVFGTYLNNAPGNVLYNNLVISPNENWDGIKGGDWTRSNNLWFRTIEEAAFVDPASNDYNLKAGSPAIDAGIDVSSFGIDTDHGHQPRPKGAYDVGAYEY